MTDDLQQARVEAVARKLAGEDQGYSLYEYPHSKSDREGFRKEARSILAAADAHLPTEEQIAEVIMRALVFTNENSKPWADGVARDVHALFGEVAGDE